MSTRIPALVFGLLVVLTEWVALLSWSPLVTDAGRFLVPALVSGVLIALIGTWARGARLPLPLVLLLQVVGCVLWFGLRFSGDGVLGLLPTPGHLGGLVDMVQQGSATINKYASPVPARFSDVAGFLTVSGTGLMLVADVLGCGLRRAPLVGLPVLLTMTIPISVLVEPMSLWVFAATAAAFLALLAWQNLTRLHGWGRQVGGPPGGSGNGSLVATSTGVSVLALAGALVLTLIVPVGHGLDLHGAGGSGPGDRNSQVTVVNPIVNLRRDLLHETHTSLLTARTNAANASYLRLAVLDDFTGTQWRPSPRQLPSGNTLDAPLPRAPGLNAGIPGVQTEWEIKLSQHFRTNWLPTPYPETRVYVPGDWRYAANTLDIVNVGKPDASRGLSYRVDAFQPAFTPRLLEVSSFAAPPEIQQRMTRLPHDIPPVIGRVAHRVVRGSDSEYQEAVRLQDWFRSKGGFTYSLAAGPGSGMQLIANFITKGKVGYCEQFAAAMAIMGRTLGIPTRVVVGFLHPEKVGHHLWHYTSDNLHSWPEFYFGGVGWVRFEPTPGVHTGQAPRYTDPQARQAAPHQPATIPMPTPTASAKTVQPTEPKARHRDGGPGGHDSWWAALGVIVVLLGLAGLPGLVRRQRRRRWLDPDHPPSECVRGAWWELRATAVDNGVGWLEGRSPRQTLAKLRERVTADPALVAELDWFTVQVERHRFAADFDLSAQERARVRRVVADWSQAIRENAPDRARRWARLWPRTVFEAAPDNRRQPEPAGSAR